MYSKDSKQKKTHDKKKLKTVSDSRSCTVGCRVGDVRRTVLSDVSNQFHYTHGNRCSHHQPGNQPTELHHRTIRHLVIENKFAKNIVRFLK